MSAQHAMRLRRIRDGTLGRLPGAPKPVEVPANGGGKKRKADDDDDDELAKKRKMEVQDKALEGPLDEHTHEVDSKRLSQHKGGEAETVASIPQSTETTETPPSPSNHHRNNPMHSISTVNDSQHIDEDEWAAFERDIASPPPTTTVLASEATISAAPLSAAEIAAQARENASLQSKDIMEAVIEGEKEDATRRLEEEFEEMVGLEERVRLLREKREALRKEKRGAEDAGMSEKGNDADDDHDDSGSDEEEDDWDNWGR